jgi:hypothetical protein
MKLRTRLHTFVGFFRSCAANRLAWLFACLHAAWFFLAIANMSPPSPALADFFDKGGASTAALLAGRPFHFHYESALLQLLVLADFPSMLVEVLPCSVVVAFANDYPSRSLCRIVFWGWTLASDRHVSVVGIREVSPELAIFKIVGSGVPSENRSLFRGSYRLYFGGHRRVRSDSEQPKPTTGLSPPGNIIPRETISPPLPIVENLCRTSLDFPSAKLFCSDCR